jgi:hypothetical protein
MSIRSLRAGRQNYPPETYLGTKGELFYIEAIGEFRICDGVTPGGTPVPLALATSTIAGSVKPGSGFTVDSNGVLTINAGPMFELNGSNTFQLKPATSTQIGGIKSGPGVVISADGTLFIDTEGLPFAFGDFTALVGTYPDSTDYAILSSIKENEDIVIASNGTGRIRAVGEFSVFATDGDLNDVLEAEPFFQVKTNGQIRMLVPVIEEQTAALKIVGNSTGDTVVPNQDGVVLHVTGNPGLVSRNYLDGVDSYALLVGRRYNGTSTEPTPVLNNELFFRIAGQASVNDDFNLFGPCQIDWVATEDQGPDNQGGELRLRATPNGTSAFNGIVDVAKFNATTGVTSSIGFVGNLTGTATTATNLAAATGILAGVLNIDPNTITRSTASVQTFTLTGLTTNHKIVITSGTAFGYGLFISAAFASAANTLSIEFQNFLGNQDVNLPPKDLQYFAWV